MESSGIRLEHLEQLHRQHVMGLDAPIAGTAHLLDHGIGEADVLIIPEEAVETLKRTVRLDDHNATALCQITPQAHEVVVAIGM